jgi:transposase
MNEVAKMYPQWVTQHKKKGTNISCINGRYYLYAVASVWNKEKGRAQMVNKGYLGRITEEGFIPKHEKKPAPETRISVKEYGATNAIYEMSGDILNRLREIFGEEGEMIYAMALLRFLRNCPFKRVELSYQNSYISELLPCLNLSGKEISGFLRRFGEDRKKIISFMSGFIGEGGHMLFDGMSLVSKSEKMDINRAGYNSRKKFDPQLNLMYAFSHDESMPAYYRIVSGNIRDVTAFQLCLRESGIKNAVIVADKGFASDDNFKLLEGSDLIPILNHNGINYPWPTNN